MSSPNYFYLSDQVLGLKFINNNHKYLNVFQIAVDFARKGQKVWYVRATQMDQLPLNQFNEEDQQINRDTLRNIYFKCIKTPKALFDDLITLHLYRGNHPTIVIIDYLDTFFGDVIEFDEFSRNHMLITATLHNSIESLAKCLNRICYSILCVNTERHSDFYDRFKQTFVDAYFTNTNDIFTSSQELRNVFCREIL